MDFKQRSTLIKGRTQVSVITFLLLLIFLFIAAKYGLIGGGDRREDPANGKSQSRGETAGMIESEPGGPFHHKMKCLYFSLRLDDK